MIWQLKLVESLVNLILPKLTTLYGRYLRVVGSTITQHECMARKEYYPNNWQEYKDAPDDNFIPHTFEELMSWKVAGWELPSSVCCVIRVMNTETRKVTEHVYQKRSAAQQKVNALINTPNIEFTVADHEAIHHLTPTEDND
jgi:HD-like signal output (HDOD) protein